MPETFDVFLSHNSQDKPAVRDLAVALRDRGLRVWFDEWSLPPGSDWQAELEKVIARVPAGAVVVGQDGLGPWEDREMKALLSEFASRKTLVIPVLLPGVARAPKLPIFLRAFTWLDLREGLTDEKLDRLESAIRARLPKPRKPRPAAEPPEPELDAFRARALELIEHIPLIGIGGGDFRLRFEEIYVPLRLAARQASFEQGAHGLERAFEEERDLTLSDLFGQRRGTGPHAVVLGHPGAGKTTVLRKIEHQCLTQGPESLGLAAGTVPLFVRLRQLAREDLEKDPAELLADRLATAAGATLPAGLGRRLWLRGRLLLLLDGLDELGDAGFRAEVCRYLETHLPGAEGRQVVAAVSCRFTGWGGKVTLAAPRFRAVEVRPLDAAGCRRLVERWFEELERAHPDLKSEARRGSRELLATLESADYRTQRLKVLVGSPLLLTLLCLIVLRGRQIPRHRWAFYDECLRVLLGQWSHGKALEAGQAGAAPVNAQTALTVLRGIAWEIHRRASDLPRTSFVVRLGQRLKPIAPEVSGEQVFVWLQREAGVLGELSAGGYGFRHLGLEEYLAALHAASSGEELLDEVAGRFGSEGWREIPLLLVGLPDRGLFAPFLERLLAEERWLSEIDLLRDCLEEAAEVDLAPFLPQLDEAMPPVRQAAVLRLLSGRKEPELVERAERLSGSADLNVAALAGQLVREARGGGGRPAKRELFVLWHREDPRGEEAARRLLEAVNGQGLRCASPQEEPSWEEELDRIRTEHRALALVAVPGGRGPWEEESLADLAAYFTLEHQPVVMIHAPGEGEAPAWPEAPATAFMVDLRKGFSNAAEAIERALQGQVGEREAHGAPAIVRGAEEAWIEPLTGMRFLSVPGGRFKRGENRFDDERPIHWVTLSPFWLAETAVTNRQYGVFLEEADYREPEFWRDMRYSTPEQPVVGVSWQDAVAFCRWLSETSRHEVKLPSEAQWEFAARGTDRREYPWGNDAPDETRACFGVNSQSQPATVGSFPAGRGPFGHLDLAGNVLEWCQDSWDEEAYEKYAKGPDEPVDPVVIVAGVEEGRVIRGGAFWGSARYLRAAYRLRFRAGSRDIYIGFRCAAAAPPSLGP